MGLFDIFKKKTNPTPEVKSTGENAIETSLRNSSTSNAFKADFYKNLLEENLIILTNNSETSAGERLLPEDTKVNIMTLDGGKIPVFTSPSRILDKGVIKEEVPYLAIKGRDLFNLAKGATFVLNPYSDFGKELLPGEVESLMDGTILFSNHKQLIVQQDTQVQVGQPAVYPTEIVEALKAIFANRPGVRAAYLGWIFNPESGEPPHLIFAIDLDGDKQSIINEAGNTAYQLSKPTDIIDFIQISDQPGVSDYFTQQTTPFYKR